MSRIRARKSGQLVIAPVINTQPATQDSLVAENEALKQIKALGLNNRPLREYALSVGKAQKNCKGYMYSSTFITDLANN